MKKKKWYDTLFPVASLYSCHLEPSLLYSSAYFVTKRFWSSALPRVATLLSLKSSPKSTAMNWASSCVVAHHGSVAVKSFCDVDVFMSRVSRNPVWIPIGAVHDDDGALLEEGVAGSIVESKYYRIGYNICCCLQFVSNIVWMLKDG